MDDLNGRFQSLREMEIIEAACPYLLMCFVAIATLLTHDRGTFLKAFAIRTEPGVLVVRTGQRLLGLHDLNAVGQTGREAFPGPWLLLSIKPSIPSLIFC
jgi:hypothetical protein